MLNHRTESGQSRASTGPLLELFFYYANHQLQFGKVTIVQAEAANQFPNPLNGIEIWAVGRQKGQLESWFLGFAPRKMQSSMVIFCVVNNHDDAAARSTTGLAHLAKKAPRALAVELFRFPQGHELPVSQGHRAEIANGLARRMMQQHRVFLLRRHPHPATRSVLLKMHFIHSPQINAFVLCPLAEFFYRHSGLAHRREQSADVVYAGESPTAETSVGIGALSVSPQNAGPERPKAFYRPTSRRVILQRRAAAARRSARLPPAHRSNDEVARPFLRRPGRQSRARRSDGPNTLPCAAHRPTDWPLPGKSIPPLPGARHASGGHSAPARNDESHPVGPKSFLLYPVSLAVSYPLT